MLTQEKINPYHDSPDPLLFKIKTLNKNNDYICYSIFKKNRNIIYTITTNSANSLYYPQYDNTIRPQKAFTTLLYQNFFNRNTLMLAFETYSSDIVFNVIDIKKTFLFFINKQKNHLKKDIDTIITTLRDDIENLYPVIIKHISFIKEKKNTFKITLILDFYTHVARLSTRHEMKDIHLDIQYKHTQHDILRAASRRKILNLSPDALQDAVLKHMHSYNTLFSPLLGRYF